MHEVTLSLAYQHAAGWFARWESHWYGQQSFGYAPARLDEAFWQHELWAGWHGWQRRFTAQVGLLNLTGQDYRLNPLNETARLARARTVVVSLRLDF